MRFHIQPTNMGWFVLRPRVRVYRRPLLIWIRWFDKSFFIDFEKTAAPSQSVGSHNGGDHG